MSSGIKKPENNPSSTIDARANRLRINKTKATLIATGVSATTMGMLGVGDIVINYATMPTELGQLDINEFMKRVRLYVGGSLLFGIGVGTWAGSYRKGYRIL